jgi:uncharacterized membrane protein
MLAINFTITSILAMFLVPLLQFSDSRFHFYDRFVKFFVLEFDQPLLLVSIWFFMSEWSLKLIIPCILIIPIEHSLLPIIDLDYSMHDCMVIVADLMFLKG